MTTGNSTFTWAHALHLHSTLSPFASPVPSTHPAFDRVQPVSWKRINVAGLLVTLYGLQELPSDVREVACLWLLHGRGDTQDSMAYTAAGLLETWWNTRKSGQKHLICVGIDQRNHGSRMVDNLANVSWKQGNPTHAMDMFSTYSGTASDVSHLLDHLPSYLPFAISDHYCGGVSLGGHATWQILLSEPRIRAGMVVIGCPDYVRLMADRAIRSKLPSTLDSDPPGSNFLGSPDFPPALVSAVEANDPAGLLLSELDVATSNAHPHMPTESEQTRLREILFGRLADKKIVCLSGGKDRLVPYACGEPFLTWLKNAVDPKDGWANDLGIEVVDFVDPDARHEFTRPMRDVAETWLCELLSGEKEHPAVKGRQSKI
ncbi:Alpha/beta hydrolase family [Teratosphaeria destructans]|uniref:Alpha/beta hydrolase family n=1 Tax=Teratosphaeria destructans TaxID=418781 RepID=A0A9W7SPV8_9PEZI|nr:Alpha/beta hydrolase family [Teratosphaeria destructans]